MLIRKFHSDSACAQISSHGQLSFGSGKTSSHIPKSIGSWQDFLAHAEVLKHVPKTSWHMPN